MNGELSVGDNGVETLAVPVPSLEDEITAEIEAIDAELRKTQAGEVYEKFLYEARSLARKGLVELAKRKHKAALRVLKGGGGDE